MFGLLREMMLPSSDGTPAWALKGDARSIESCHDSSKSMVGISIDIVQEPLKKLR